jgi:hypothetical protein
MHSLSTDWAIYVGLIVTAPRTCVRDFCRDRIPEGRNPLETGVVDGYLSALWNPGEPLLNPY